MTSIELSDTDAEKFKLFCKHYDSVERLIDSGFFDTRGASAVVHFDKDGSIRRVETMVVRVFPLMNLQ